MNNFGRHLIPHYDELTLFVMSLICVLLFIVNIDFLRDAHFSFTEGDPGSLIIFIVFFAGLVLSVYHIIVRKIKTNLEKLLMLFFAVFLNAASGLTGGTYALEHSRGELAIFPIMNIVSGALLLYMARERIIDESSILE